MEPDKRQSLDQVLESATVVSWADLMSGAQTGVIHIEYGFAVGGTLDYLQVWSSIARGHWLLACEYWMSASTLHAGGVHFENGYHSEGLAHILESVMQHQSVFNLPLNLDRQGLLQIATPTEEESRAAAASVREAYERVSSEMAQPVLA
jgi:hypothetical protein